MKIICSFYSCVHIKVKWADHAHEQKWAENAHEQRWADFSEQWAGAELGEQTLVSKWAGADLVSRARWAVSRSRVKWAELSEQWAGAKKIEQIKLSMLRCPALSTEQKFSYLFYVYLQCMRVKVTSRLCFFATYLHSHACVCDMAIAAWVLTSVKQREIRGE